MFAHLCLCLMFLTGIYLHSIEALPRPITSDTNPSDNQLSDASMFEHLGANHFLINHQYENDNSDEDEIVHDKRQMKRKWTNFYQGSAHSPYTIAFPALIRSRRWIK